MCLCLRVRVLVIANEWKYTNIFIFMSYGCSFTKRKKRTENITNVQNMIKIAFFSLFIQKIFLFFSVYVGACFSCWCYVFPLMHIWERASAVSWLRNKKLFLLLVFVWIACAFSRSIRLPFCVLVCNVRFNN